MAVNIPGLVVLGLFYMVILVVGVVAARKKRARSGNADSLESSIVAGRNIGAVVGIFTMTATTVGGGYINGTAESIATAGLVWTLAPFGIFIGLNIGGLVFARKMREQMYLTMLDPFQEVYGNVVVFLVYIASLFGDLFWTASILSALGTSLSVILDLSRTVSIAASAAVTVSYTMIGQMISVAYTDIVQLLLITGGLVLCIPFVLTNENVGNIGEASRDWIGQFDSGMTSPWIDLFIAMTFGTIPWQAYFQRVLSVKSAKEAQILSMVGGASALILVTPSVLIGAAAVSADWTNTSLGVSPMEAGKADMVLPFVLNEFTPVPVAVVGLGAVCAAVMSSMDSSVLGSSSMFTNNIYKQLVRPKASNTELMWVQRLAILIIGTVATVISLLVPGVYGLFILAADVVFVIVLPQLICAVFLKWTNWYGASCGYIVGTVLRVGAGEPSINLAPFILYPMYDVTEGQKFPFRTFAMISSLVVVVTVSIFTNFIGLPSGKALNNYTLQPTGESFQQKRDICRKHSETNSKKCEQFSPAFTNCDCTCGLSKTSNKCQHYSLMEIHSQCHDANSVTMDVAEDFLSNVDVDITDDEFTNCTDVRGYRECNCIMQQGKDPGQQTQEMVQLNGTVVSR